VESLRGKLLVATPELGDPNFDRAVMLVIEHNDEGALAVVLNRVSAMPSATVLPEWSEILSDPPLIFYGGPVEPAGAIGLALATADLGDGFSPVIGGVGSVDLSMPDLRDQLVELRIFQGYAGWSPGQLDGELLANAWFSFDADPADVLTPSPDTLWHDVFARQSGSVSQFAVYPDDPSCN
jgi:putative transcriptional regulator